MVEVARGVAEAALKIENLEDFESRVEAAARRVDEEGANRDTAAMVIYEVALARSGRPRKEVAETVRRFREAFADEEQPLTIPHTSGIMNVEGDRWFFDDSELRALTGRLLGQFQHRVAQYNYVAETEVLRRWADGYDTRLFIRRRIFDTEPVAGVVPGMDLIGMQRLRVAGGGDTLVPTENVRRALEALGIPGIEDEYGVLAGAEAIALYLDLPAPVVGAILEGLASDGVTRFPEPPPETSKETPDGTGEEDASAASPGEGDEDSRQAVRDGPRKGDEPTRVQDAQAKDAPGVAQEAAGGTEKGPSSPRTGRDDGPGKSGG